MNKEFENDGRTHIPLLRVMSLHALSYCERLFYLEEVEEIRLADASVFAGRKLHEELKNEEEESGEWTSRELTSEKLGLIGKVDCLRRRDGKIIPYEHKRGKPRREGKKAVPWDSDVVQIGAYGLLLEEETGESIAEGRIRYHAENITVRVPLDEQVREKIRQVILRANVLRNSTARPPIANNDRLCIRCSLAPVCLPEEERQANQPGFEPIRLFPADRETKTLHILEHGTRVGRSGDTLKVETVKGEEKFFPIREVGSVVMHGYSQITTQAIHFCARSEIPIHWISPGNHYLTSLPAGPGGVQRRHRQYKALGDSALCLGLAKKAVFSKVSGVLGYVLRSTRGEPRTELILKIINTLKCALKGVHRSNDQEELRGFEGMAGHAWFQAIPFLLRKEVPVDLGPNGRNRRPPRDRFNALLSFGYSLLQQTIMQAILSVGLEPAFGFFHTPRSAAFPLVLDLMELLRLPVWDIALIGSINRLHWDPIWDFSVSGKRVWLSDEGAKKVIRLFENRLEEVWKHPLLGYSLTYYRMIELEVRLLEKEWSGGAGLFARVRLR